MASDERGAVDENRDLIGIRSKVRRSNIDFMEGGLRISGHEVVILGAGFSRAVSEAFPLTDELGRDAAERAGLPDHVLPPGGFHDGNFETWLSQLADAPPYCLEEEVFQRRAILASVTRSLDVVLRDREYTAFAHEGPPWLFDFAGLAHLRQMVLVTFNYDTTIETAIQSHSLWHHNGLPHSILADDLLENMPPRYSGGVPVAAASSGGAGIAPTLRLLKLHGSLDWFWSAGDATGATLRRVSTLHRFGAPVLDDPELRDREAPGLTPFIVPPTATKSEYFRNPLTRRLWRAAFDALRGATRISLVGYSLPAADLLAAAMFGDALRGREATVDVVNPCPDEPVERLRGLGIADPIVTSGKNCVESFVGSMRDRFALGAADQLRVLPSAADDAVAIVRWGTAESKAKGPREAYVERLEPSGRELQLIPMAGCADTGRALRTSTLRSALGAGATLALATSKAPPLPIVGLKLQLGGSSASIDFLELFTCGKVPL